MHYKKIFIFITLIFLILNAFTFLSIRYVKSNNLVISKDFTIYYKISNKTCKTLVDLINLEGIQKSLVNFSNNELSLNQIENLDFIFTFSAASKLLQIKTSFNNISISNYDQKLKEMKEFTIYFRNNFDKYFQEKLLAYDLADEEAAKKANDSTLKLIQILDLIIKNKDAQINNILKNQALDFLEEDLIPNFVEELKNIENNNYADLVNIALENDNFVESRNIINRVNEQTLSLYVIYFIIYLVVYLILISAIFVKNKLHAKT